MNYGHIFLSILSWCFIGIGVALEACPVSIRLWELPNETYALVIGDVHCASKSAEELEQIIKQSVATLKNSNIPIKVLLENNKLVQEAMKQMGCTPRWGIESTLARFIVGNYSSEDADIYNSADRRGPSQIAFDEIMVGLSDLQKINNSEQLYNALQDMLDEKRSIRTNIPDNKVYAAQKGDFIKEMNAVLTEFKKAQETMNDKYFAKLLTDAQEYNDRICSFFNKYADKNPLFDIAVITCRNEEAVSGFLKTFEDSSEKNNSIADAGFIMDLMRNINEGRNSILYVGDTHAKVINKYLEEVVKANSMKNINNNIDYAAVINLERKMRQEDIDIKDLKNIVFEGKEIGIVSVKEFAEMFTEFQERCLAQSKKRKREEESQEAPDNKKQATESQQPVEQSPEKEVGCVDGK